MLYGQSCTLTFTHKKKRWVFPYDRFVEYGPEDEGWARFVGFGHEEEVVETVRIPNVVIKGITPRGEGCTSIDFVAMPSYCEGTFDYYAQDIQRIS